MDNFEILAELKKVELEILKSFIGVCKKLNLKYYLVYGTLIGAIRHKGFIPWDDDIDIAMPRKDYEEFLRVGQDLLPEHLFIQHIGTEPDFLMTFAKIRNSNTTFMQKSDSKFKINHGVFIDVVPLDYYPEDEKLFHKILAKKKDYDFRINSALNHGTKKNIKTKLKIALYKIKYPSLKSVVNKAVHLYKSVPQSTKYTVYCFAKPQLNVAPIEWFGDGIEMEFEGIKAAVPNEYHKWNTQIFGDYMQLPPAEDQIPHHFTQIIDLTKSYKEYI